ncbi:hypothetical protein [Parageobacillus sp. VR-IP]|uniref:hypothetical protein n=1 Tax=Parageobacillus sp. VR-IP TaxID=2742205 RepID=UPI0035C6FFAA
MRSREDGQLRKSAATNSSLAVNKAVKRILSGKDTEGTGRRLGDASVREDLDDTLPVHQTVTPQETVHPFHVIVTDHTDLGEQTTNTFRRCGLPNPRRAESVWDLCVLLWTATGATIMTTIQMFQDHVDDGGDLLLNDEDNIFVLVDESHRF